MLRAFRSYQVRATWAAVGFLLFDTKKELLDYLPSHRPSYARAEFDPYPDMDSIGETEKADPYHLGLSLVRQIIDCEGMELGSHTFSHYYCLEEGQTVDTFRADLEASVAATRRLTKQPVSLIFPRNQYSPAYLRVCADCGIVVVRSNERSRLYQASRMDEVSLPQRCVRLADAYLDISGDNAFVPLLEQGILTMPSSRFLRPFEPRLRVFDRLKTARIKNAMTAAAKRNLYFHLWWHPHNFGVNIDENMACLEDILRHHVTLRDRYGVRSLTMGEAAENLRRPA